MIALALAVSGCTGSGGSADAVRAAAAIDAGNLPPSVYIEAARVTALPVEQIKAGQLSAADTKKLVVALRRSELRKVGALKAAISQHERKRKHYKSRGKKAR